MSQDNVELVREHVKAFLAKDTERANAFLDPQNRISTFAFDIHVEVST